MKSLYRKLAFLLILCFCLQGCLLVLGGAAIGAAGAAIIYDHRNVHTIMGDESVSRHLLLALQSNTQIKQQCHIVISTYHGIILLAGQAPTQALKQTIQKIAKKETSGKRLYNEITIEGPTSGLTRTSDSWITTKVKTKLIDTPGLKSGSIKVVTENGTVYLMGHVSKPQAQLATNVAKAVSGVQKVVTIFQYKRNVEPELSAINRANTAAETHENSPSQQGSAETKPGKTQYIGM